MATGIDKLSDDACSLLKELIRKPSFSREEDKTADCIASFLKSKNIEAWRDKNNVFAINQSFKPGLPTILLNSHHDTVRPNSGYTKNPFDPVESEGKIFGLGSNDAGGPLVALISTFCTLYEKKNPKYNLVLAATAEEEISGKDGIESLLGSGTFNELTHAGNFSNWSAIVGEPTQMRMAIAERGLMVIDCVCRGKSGHAARDEGINSLYLAMEDISRIRKISFDKVSPLLGPVKLSVTMIETDNKTHNIVPAECRYTVDVRTNEFYTFEEILTILDKNLSCDFKPRSTRLRSTIISEDHFLVKAGKNLTLPVFGSPTTSDKAIMPFPALKLGPGDSSRSHTADEFIFRAEITDGIRIYLDLLNSLL